MKRIFILVITGDIGFKVGKKLAAEGHWVSGLYRKDEDAKKLNTAGITPVKGDLTKLGVEDLEKLLSNIDVVIFTAGANSPDPTLSDKIDFQGVVISADAAEKQYVGRYILVSAFPEAGRARPRSESFERYIANKKKADAYLTSKKIDWVIARPGKLLKEEPTGKVKIAPALPYGDITRDDFASVIYQLVFSDIKPRSILEVLNGDTPVAQAISEYSY